MQQNGNPRRLREKGFTLVELMVVVSIIGILAAVGAPRLFAYVRASQTAEVTQVVGAIAKGVQGYAAGKTPAAVSTTINAANALTPDDAMDTELTTVIPEVSVAPDTNFSYVITTAVAAAGTPAAGELVYCIKATGRAAAGVPSGIVLFSSHKTAANGWDSNVNKTHYVTNAGTAATAGGYCLAAGTADGTYTP